MSLTFGELGDQVHGYDFEGKGVVGGWDVEGGDFFLMHEIFALLASGASLHEVCYPYIHPWPPKVVGYLTCGFVSSRVSCCR